MKKFTLSLLLACFPVLALAADQTFTFAPPPGDYSVVFLGNIFGVVDGVLHGTGSQIMGSMFAVLNAAVLALGGIVIMYTLIVSTLNTAQEGQFLGQKWSSLWVPVRTTFGLALLIPKASGYCLMQIFVMWVIVQGVGAADKVWDAALGYLNGGGSIVMNQPNPAKSMLSSSSDASSVPYGAQVILAGQVCMLGMQKQLENQRTTYLQQKSNQAGPSGPCVNPANDNMKSFCSNAVPDFISTVNIISAQSKQKYSVDMPNFTDDPLYSQLNGICGQIKWNEFSFSNESKVSQVVSSGDVATAKMSRAIAIQQMYIDLSMVAQVMVNNDPQLSSQQQQSTTTTTSNYSPVAEQQYGVPQTISGEVCASVSTDNCKMWGTVPGSSGAPLFTGTEFQGAISDYHTIMLPTLTLQEQANNAGSASDARQFIQNATSQGWIMAGSYFFNLVRLNVAAMEAASDLSDTGNGLQQSTLVSPTKALTGWSDSCNNSSPPVLCDLFNNDNTKLKQVADLITGASSPTASAVSASGFSSGNRQVDDDSDSKNDSTVFGFVNNSTILQISDSQPGGSGASFKAIGNIPPPDLSSLQLPYPSFSCGGGRFFFFVCIGNLLGTMLWYIVATIYNAFMALFGTVIEQFIWGFLQMPLQAMAAIFQQGVNIITQPGINPVVALANMGTYYINFAGNLWIELIMMAALPIVNLILFPMIALTLPLLLTWTSIMVGIGFTTAYYVPVLPYVIFTLGSIAWLIAVIEAMVAAPIVALGVTHPEGHEAFGKGEQAIMILMNVFLRPSMMIIGYIAAIALSYVGVWILNAGFQNAIGFLQGTGAYGTDGSLADQIAIGAGFAHFTGGVSTGAGTISGGYTGWAGVYAYFFSILIYTMLYLTIVQKAFSLIAYLPDKVLRWIGGAPESLGQEAAQWGDETKGKIGESGKETQGAQAAIDKQLSGYATKATGWAKKKLSQSGGGGAEATGGSKKNSSQSGQPPGGKSSGKSSGGQSGQPPGGGESAPPVGK
ncbi:type IVB secretion system protein DotA [Legionella nagasakiensis]|uniref:type IVB secretion system protein DotA n=1 Tax=Legionella nagasakiensis TaxID=535290 RepID=UPI0010568632|nr:type IVB secretion system protein DotA [Legionella nagasakiensis]